MCEIMSLRTRHGAFKLGFALSLAERLEAYGDAGHGWGVAWVQPGSNVVRMYKSPRSIIKDEQVYQAVGDRWATTCMIHLRMPSDFSTIGTPDTQPFLGTLGMAFAHNGYLPDHTKERTRYEAAGLLKGRADSEVALHVLQDFLVDSIDAKTGNYDVATAMRQTHRMLGGWRANFTCLFPGGWHYAYASHVGNPMYTLKWMGMEAIVTGMHRRDSKLVRMLFPGCREVVKIQDEDVVVWPADRTKPARLLQATKNKAAAKAATKKLAEAAAAAKAAEGTADSTPTCGKADCDEVHGDKEVNLTHSVEEAIMDASRMLSEGGGSGTGDQISLPDPSMY